MAGGVGCSGSFGASASPGAAVPVRLGSSTADLHLHSALPVLYASVIIDTHTERSGVRG